MKRYGWSILLVFACFFPVQAGYASVSYLGPVGTYTEEAARLYFPVEKHLLAADTVDSALQMVTDGRCDYVVIPQENTLGGPVYPYLDAMLRHRDLVVRGSIDLSIRQNLLGLKDSTLSDIHMIKSHPQGLQQSQKWLREHLPAAGQMETPSTAAAAQQVADGRDPRVAAIGSVQAARVYHLKVLAENLQDSEYNVTRFYILGKAPGQFPEGGHVLLVAQGKAEDLPVLMGKLAQAGFSLVSIHDRPRGTVLGEYQYVLELEHGNFSQILALKKAFTGRMTLEIRGIFPAVSGKRQIRGSGMRGS